VVELLSAGGADGISVPDAARLSGVSLRTVYRYYPTRDDLLDAASDWIYRRTFDQVPVERELAELPAVMIAGAEQWEAHPRLARAIAYAPSLKPLVNSRRAERIAQITREVAGAAPNLSERERREAAAVLAYLQSIRTWVTLRQDIGLGRDETIGAVGWALQTLIDDLRRRNRAAVGKGERNDA
jgi:AcrR family transcriptional regulator